MYRRDFLNSSLCALTAGTLLANDNVLATDNLFSNENTASIDDAIDAHVHVWDKFSENYPLATGFSEADRVPASFTPGELFAQCRPQGVKQIVLIQMNFFGFAIRALSGLAWCAVGAGLEMQITQTAAATFGDQYALFIMGQVGNDFFGG